MFKLGAKSCITFECSKKLSESAGGFVSEVNFVTLRENAACRNDLKRPAVSEIERKLHRFFQAPLFFSTFDGVRIAL